jgi:hypothetical protein
MTSGDATRDAIAGELAACATLCAGLERAYARRRALMLAADAAGMSRAEIARLSGLSARSGRISQILGARPSLYRWSQFAPDTTVTSERRRPAKRHTLDQEDYDA